MTSKLEWFIQKILSFWHLRPTLWCVCSISSLLLFVLGFLLTHFFIGTMSFLCMIVLLVIQCTDNFSMDEKPEKGRSRKKR